MKPTKYQRWWMGEMWYGATLQYGGLGPFHLNRLTNNNWYYLYYEEHWLQKCRCAYIKTASVVEAIAMRWIGHESAREKRVRIITSKGRKVLEATWSDFDWPYMDRYSGKLGKWVAQLSKTNTGNSFLVPPEDYGDNLGMFKANLCCSARSQGLKIETKITNKGLRVHLGGPKE